WIVRSLHNGTAVGFAVVSGQRPPVTRMPRVTKGVQSQSVVRMIRTKRAVSINCHTRFVSKRFYFRRITRPDRGSVMLKQLDPLEGLARGRRRCRSPRGGSGDECDEEVCRYAFRGLFRLAAFPFGGHSVRTRSCS